MSMDVPGEPTGGVPTGVGGPLDDAGLRGLGTLALLSNEGRASIDGLVAPGLSMDMRGGPSIDGLIDMGPGDCIPEVPGL